jgi:hypothetical protein
MATFQIMNNSIQTRIRRRLAVCILIAAALLVPTLVKATPVLWGPSGSHPTTGLLDSSLIPLSTGTSPVRYTNVNGEGYDIVVSTSGLSQSGTTSFLGDQGWNIQGTSPSTSSYSIVTFHFYATGTNTPIGINGTDLVFQDAEVDELFGGFSYFDASGNQVPLLFNNPIFGYSYGANFFLNDTQASNAALEQGGPQTGKSIGINMSAMNISGFTIGLHRQTSAAGSVIMMGLGNLSVAP